MISTSWNTWYPMIYSPQKSINHNYGTVENIYEHKRREETNMIIYSIFGSLGPRQQATVDSFRHTQKLWDFFQTISFDTLYVGMKWKKNWFQILCLICKISKTKQCLPFHLFPYICNLENPIRLDSPPLHIHTHTLLCSPGDHMLNTASSFT